MLIFRHAGIVAPMGPILNPKATVLPADRTLLRSMDPTSGQTAASFHTTLWSLVLGARGDRSALEHLLRAYWSPVYAFIRRQGYPGHDASDLTQDFLTQVVIGRDLLGRADPERGRFRAFLKHALKNFLIDQHRLHRVSKRSGGGTGVAAGGDHPEPDVADSRVPEIDAMFDREWAATVLELTLTRLEEACRADGLAQHWEVFNLNVLGPAVRKSRAVPLDELAGRFGAVDATQLSNMLQTVKRRFRKTLREVVAETVSDESQVEQELSELRSLF